MTAVEQSSGRSAGALAQGGTDRVPPPAADIPSPSMRGDATFRRVLAIFATMILIILAAMLVMLIAQSFDAWRTFGLKFIIDSDWNPPFNRFGALPYIYGT